MSRPSDHIDFQFRELNNLNDALRTLQRLGIGPLEPAYNAVFQARNAALGKLGLAKPRTTTLVKLLAGLSPGELRLFLDAELGWLVEAVEKPGSPPVRRYVDGSTAVKIIQGELTHDEFMKLHEPADEYIA